MDQVNADSNVGVTCLVLPLLIGFFWPQNALDHFDNHSHSSEKDACTQNTHTI